LKLVVDASVALKWYLGDRPEEPDIAQAAAVGETIERQNSDLLAPPHWIIEIISVLARKEPAIVNVALAQLTDMRPHIVDHANVVRRAALLAQSLNAHLFDTLYHAVALEYGATLVTADDRYFAKAQGQGSVVMLKDFAAPA